MLDHLDDTAVSARRDARAGGDFAKYQLGAQQARETRKVNDLERKRKVAEFDCMQAKLKEVEARCEELSVLCETLRFDLHDQKAAHRRTSDDMDRARQSLKAQKSTILRWLEFAGDKPEPWDAPSMLRRYHSFAKAQNGGGAQ